MRIPFTWKKLYYKLSRTYIFTEKFDEVYKKEKKLYCMEYFFIRDM